MGVEAEEYINNMRAYLVHEGRSLYGDNLEYPHDWAGVYCCERVQGWMAEKGLGVMGTPPLSHPI
jgi:hypothetical protein